MLNQILTREGARPLKQAMTEGLTKVETPRPSEPVSRTTPPTAIDKAMAEAEAADNDQAKLRTAS